MAEDVQLAIWLCICKHLPIPVAVLCKAVRLRPRDYCERGFESC